MQQVGQDPEQLIAEFAAWKQTGAAGEYNNYYFGKDGEYSRPVINGRRVLRHVHLPPNDDERSMHVWRHAWSRNRRRVSDTALVYADGGRFGYLLIAILWSPTAHSTARMATIEDRELMNNFAETAEQFMFFGTWDV